MVPLQVLEVSSLAGATDAIRGIAASRGITLVVIGLPTDLDGAETDACRRSHLLAEGLAAARLETRLQPEVLTSDEARRRARVAGRTRGAATDDLAAQVLLEEFFADSAAADRTR